MQAELLVENPATKIRLLGINAAGYESGNAAICAGRTIPWLQDVAAQNVWGTWAPVYRDVIICDTANIRQAVYNVSLPNDLGVAANYAYLKALLKSVAGE